MSENPFTNLHLVDHPLVQHKLSFLRDKTTQTPLFRALLREIALLIGYEITRGLPMDSTSIETTAHGDGGAHPARPQARHRTDPAGGPRDGGRAGRALADGAARPTSGSTATPDTHRPVEYYVRLPADTNRLFILVDPMLATGYSASYAVDLLNRNGIDDSNVRFMAMVASPEGMRAFNERHATVEVWAASLDECLNEKAYIVPGLGDAGDRLFGTD